MATRINSPSPVTILGIDPGTSLMGYGVIEVRGHQLKLMDMDCLRPGAARSHYQKLQLIFDTVSGLIIRHQPQVFAIEAPFFGKNVQSMLKLGRAQGVAIAAAMRHGIPVTEYAPKKVKQSVTGNGNASKEQVLLMLQRLLGFTDAPRYLDASDALAVAVCHFLQGGAAAATQPAPTRGTGSKGWAAFVAAHPNRITGSK